MEGKKKLGWDEEDLVKAVKILAGTATVPLKVAADIASDITGSLESYVPKPTELVSTVIDMRIKTLKTFISVIEKEIGLLEKYKEDLGAKEETKEKVKVE
jgi:hypothetical protein